ncbi:cx9C motif-containing protein 4-like [Glandiceps talaboti]
MSQPQKKTEPCKKYACEIQRCLKAHKYNETACRDVIRQMAKCCEKFGTEDSDCCSGFKHAHGTYLKSLGLKM